MGTERGDQVIVVGMPRTAKVIRVGIMSRALLEETRHTRLDQAGRARLRVVFDSTVGELAGCLPPGLAAELGRLVPAIGEGVPSQAELRIAQAQLSGWLEGLLQSLQATIAAQQAAALQQLVQASRAGSQQDQPEPADAQRSDSYL
ncbi:MAG TPA: proteasome activator [Actinomycetes bacterium]|nr:proteasome activator [Actinomycetes bacterium]